MQVEVHAQPCIATAVLSSHASNMVQASLPPPSPQKTKTSHTYQTPQSAQQCCLLPNMWRGSSPQQLSSVLPSSTMYTAVCRLPLLAMRAHHHVSGQLPPEVLAGGPVFHLEHQRLRAPSSSSSSRAAAGSSRAAAGSSSCCCCCWCAAGGASLGPQALGVPAGTAAGQQGQTPASDSTPPPSWGSHLHSCRPPPAQLQQNSRPSSRPAMPPPGEAVPLATCLQCLTAVPLTLRRRLLA
jgi:hypothetical protein